MSCRGQFGKREISRRSAEVVRAVEARDYEEIESRSRRDGARSHLALGAPAGLAVEGERGRRQLEEEVELRGGAHAGQRVDPLLVGVLLELAELEEPKGLAGRVVLLGQLELAHLQCLP